MKKEKTAFFQPEVSLEREICVDVLKRNIEKYMKYSGSTLKELAENADIPYATLNNLLYSKTHKDCKISTVLCLSKAMGISVDELLGGSTLSEEEYFLLSTLRRMPERTKYLIHWFLEYQRTIAECYSKPKSRIINVMHPDLDNTYSIKPSNRFTPLDISAFSNDVKAKVFMGLHIPCGDYTPLYCPYDILLIANDRPGRSSEITAVIFYGHIHLTRRITSKIGNKTVIQYANIRDGHMLAIEDEIDMVMGYVVDIYHGYETAGAVAYG